MVSFDDVEGGVGDGDGLHCGSNTKSKSSHQLAVVKRGFQKWTATEMEEPTAAAATAATFRWDIKSNCHLLLVTWDSGLIGTVLRLISIRFPPPPFQSGFLLKVLYGNPSKQRCKE